MYQFATRIRQIAPKIHCLVNAATAVTFTPSANHLGYELNWHVNTLAPFFLTVLLRDNFVAAGTPHRKARIVNLVSKVTMCAKIQDVDMSSVLNPKECYRFSPLNCFLVSKIQQRMLTYHLGKEWEKLPVTINCVHPGFVTSPALACLGFRKGVDAIHESVRTPIAACTFDKFEGITGSYIEEEKVVDCPYHKDPMLPEVVKVCSAHLNAFVTQNHKQARIPFPNAPVDIQLKYQIDPVQVQAQAEAQAQAQAQAAEAKAKSSKTPISQSRPQRQDKAQPTTSKSVAVQN